MVEINAVVACGTEALEVFVPHQMVVSRRKRVISVTVDDAFLVLLRTIDSGIFSPRGLDELDFYLVVFVLGEHTRNFHIPVAVNHSHLILLVDDRCPALAVLVFHRVIDIVFAEVGVVEVIDNPGEGKTYFAMRLAAACTNRKPLPGMETLDPFNIIYQTAEDGLGDTVKPRLIEADADLERVLVIDDRDTPLTLADERIARAIRENNARLVIIDPVQAFLGADVDMNRANEVRPIFRSLGDIAQATGCAIVLIGHLNKAAGTQSTYRGLGSIDITAAVRSLLFIGKLKDSPTTRVLIHEKSSLAPPGQSLAFSLGDEKGFEWIGAYDITADELLAGTDTAKTESKTAQAEILILELLANGKRMPSAELEKAVNDRGISSRTMRTAKSRIGNRLVTEKDGTAWVCYLRN